MTRATWQRIFRTAIGLGLAALPAAALAEALPYAELISEVKTIQPGTPFWIGLRFQLRSAWRTCWLNPGARGAPPALQWRLPAGFTMDDPRWPVPRVFLEQGRVSLGYDGGLLLPVRITPPATLREQDRVRLGLRMDWTICREQCRPEFADLELVLRVHEGVPERNSAWAGEFAAARQPPPRPPDGWRIRAHKAEATAGRLEVAAPEPRPDTTVAFYPESPVLETTTAPVALPANGGAARLPLAPRAGATAGLPGRVRGVLLVGDTGVTNNLPAAWWVDVPLAP